MHIYMYVYVRCFFAVYVCSYIVLLCMQLLKSLDDVSCGVNILVVRLIENGGEETYIHVQCTCMLH